MKSQLTFAAFVVMVIISIGASPSPENKTIVPSTGKEFSNHSYAGFSFFRIHRQGKGVTSTWGMSSETGISGFVVQRTYFDPNDPFSPWDDICAIPSNGSRSYKWIDENVLAGMISYRIKANIIGGGEMYSETLTIRIVGH